MKAYGLIGFPLGHSFSAKYFTEKFEREGMSDHVYCLHPLESIEMLPAMLQSNPDLQGFNVTIPYKEKVMAYLDDLSDEAREIGAVNCVRIHNGMLTGHNTDAHGFRDSLLGLIGHERPKALILGTGGASKAIRHVLGKLGIDYMIVSRTKSDNTATYAQIDQRVLSERKLIVNTTPVGTYPNVDDAPHLQYEHIGEGHFLFDVVYNPPFTKFLEYGKRNGSRVMNGHRMLVGQAEKSWEIWTAE